MTYKELKEKYQKVEPIEIKNKVPNKVLVSVCIQAYNHEHFIAKSIRGALDQQTDFKYEILIGEDASSDKTREICLEYAEKYPNKIRLILNHRENNIAYNKNPSGRFNYMNIWFNTRGKYIAICDGDDFWTDTFKLQKQVSFLERNPSYSMSFHHTDVLKDGNIIKSKPPTYKKTFTTEDLILNLPVPRRSVSVVYNKEYNKKDLPVQMLINNAPGMDWSICLFASLNYKIHYIKNSMAVYRVHSGGIHSAKPTIHKINIHQHYREFLANNVFHDDDYISKLLLDSIKILEFEKAEYLIATNQVKKAIEVSKHFDYLFLLKNLKPRPLYRISKFIIRKSLKI